MACMGPTFNAEDADKVYEDLMDRLKTKHGLTQPFPEGSCGFGRDRYNQDWKTQTDTLKALIHDMVRNEEYASF